MPGARSSPTKRVASISLTTVSEPAGSRLPARYATIHPDLLAYLKRCADDDRRAQYASSVTRQPGPAYVLGETAPLYEPDSEAPTQVRPPSVRAVREPTGRVQATPLRVRESLRSFSLAFGVVAVIGSAVPVALRLARMAPDMTADARAATNTEAPVAIPAIPASPEPAETTTSSTLSAARWQPVTTSRGAESRAAEAPPLPRAVAAPRRAAEPRKPPGGSPPAVTSRQGPDPASSAGAPVNAAPRTDPVPVPIPVPAAAPRTDVVRSL